MYILNLKSLDHQSGDYVLPQKMQKKLQKNALFMLKKSELGHIRAPRAHTARVIFSGTDPYITVCKAYTINYSVSGTNRSTIIVLG